MRSVQKDFEKIGAEGCYFLSMHRAAEELTAHYIDPYEVYLKAIALHYMRDDCYVIDPAALMQMMTSVKWAVYKEGKSYQPLAGDVEILRFERVDTSKTWAHFVLGDGNGAVAYDPYEGSMTVRSGALVSKRIFRRIK
jgi:hypothetical protein